MRSAPLILALSILLLFSGNARAQDYYEARWPEIAFEPTGDALWDDYAQLLLKQMQPDADLGETLSDRLVLCQSEYLEVASVVNMDRSLLNTGSFSVLNWSELTIAVPDEKLDSLAAAHADDPRYWELRWWEAKLSQMRGTADTISDPADWLHEARSRGLIDFAGVCHLYMAERDRIKAVESRYYANELTEEDWRFLPQKGLGSMPWQWFEQRQRDLLTALVADWPEESWPHYQLADFHFNLGEWDEGLAKTTEGNEAPGNRNPLMFPFSFIYPRMFVEEPIGSEAAAGAVAAAWLVVQQSVLSESIKNKERLKDQEVRWALGAPLSEAVPHYRRAIRMANAEGATPVDSMLSTVLGNMICSYLLVEVGDALDRQQREDIHLLDRRFTAVPNSYRAPVRDNLAKLLQQVMSESEMSMEGLAEYILLGDPVTYGQAGAGSFYFGDYERTGFLSTVPYSILPSAELRPRLLAAYLASRYRYLKADLAVHQPEQSKRISELGQFDFNTYSAPEDWE